jgi:hypothetical protein
MTKAELLKALEPFDDEIEIGARDIAGSAFVGCNAILSWEYTTGGNLPTRIILVTDYDGKLRVGPTPSPVAPHQAQEAGSSSPSGD